jgi:hypothetical protein
VNKLDPSGNSWLDETWDAVFGEDSFNSTFGDSGSAWSDRNFGNDADRAFFAQYSEYQAYEQTLDYDPEEYGYPNQTYSDSKQYLLLYGSAADQTGDLGGVASSNADYELALMAAFPIRAGFNAYRSVTSVAAADLAIAGGSHSVYVSRVGGVIEYVGMTVNMSARQAAHLRTAGRAITEVASGVSKFEARDLEKAMIEWYSLANLSNQINSIAATNPIYTQAIAVGQRLMGHFGL